MKFYCVTIMVCVFGVSTASNEHQKEKIDAFKRGHCLRPNAQLPVRAAAALGKESTFQGPGGQVVTPEGCNPIANDIFGNAKVIRSDTGEERSDIDLTKLDVCAITNGNVRTTVARDGQGRLTSAYSFDTATGEMNEYIPLDDDDESGLLVEVADSDYDPDCLSRYYYDDPPQDEPQGLFGGGRFLRSIAKTAGSGAKEDRHVGDDDVARDLQTLPSPPSTICTDVENRRVIEVSIAYDSSFCSNQVNEDGALTRIALILQYASERYSQEGLCKAVKAKRLVSGCDGTDEFANAVSKGSLCGNGPNNVLGTFQRDWSLGSDEAAVHLIFGNGGYSIGPGGGSIGCAYIDALCSNNRFGVNYLSFNGAGTSLRLQGNLFAHELGHNAGSNHDPSGSGFIMNPSIGNFNEFSASSKNQINSHTNSVGCVSRATDLTCASNDDCADNVDCTDDSCVGGTCFYTLAATCGGSGPVTESPTSSISPSESPSVSLSPSTSIAPSSSAGLVSWNFSSGLHGWSVVSGTFTQVSSDGENALKSSGGSNGQCDRVMSPMIRLTSESTISLRTKFDIENKSRGTWFDRANVALYYDGVRNIITPDAGRLYNVAGKNGGAFQCALDGNEGLGRVGFGGTQLSFDNSEWTATALDLGLGVGETKDVQIDVYYGTDGAEVGGGFWFGSVNVTQAVVIGS